MGLPHLAGDLPQDCTALLGKELILMPSLMPQHSLWHHYPLV